MHFFMNRARVSGIKKITSKIQNPAGSINTIPFLRVTMQTHPVNRLFVKIPKNPLYIQNLLKD
jgi:hypothetical protein